MVIAFIILVISGMLLRYGLSKRGTKVGYLINFVAIIGLFVFVIFAFKGCQDATSTFIRPGDDDRDTTSSE